MSFDFEHLKQEARQELAPTEEQVHARADEKAHQLRNRLQEDLNSVPEKQETMRQIDEHFASHQVG